MQDTTNNMLGVLGFSRDRSLISRLIRWFTRQPWSHVFVVMYYDKNVGDHVLIEAGAGGVTISSLKKYRSGYDVEFCRMEPDRMRAGVEEVKKLLGRRYGYFQLIGFIPVVLLRRVGIKLENPITRGVVCSELAAHYLSAALDDAFWRKKADELTPGDINDVMHTLKEVTCIKLG